MGFSYNTWGTSWGTSWGNSWGAGSSPIPPAPILGKALHKSRYPRLYLHGDNRYVVNNRAEESAILARIERENELKAQEEAAKNKPNKGAKKRKKKPFIYQPPELEMYDYSMPEYDFFVPEFVDLEKIDNDNLLAQQRFDDEAVMVLLMAM